MRKSLAIRMALVSLTFSGVGPLNGAIERIGVSVIPLIGLVEEIAGEGIEVRALQEEGDACEVFEARPSLLHWMSGAQLFFRAGLGFETGLVDRLAAQSGSMRVEDLREVVQLLPAVTSGESHESGGSAGHAAHVHGKHCAHGCSGHGWASDPHVWLDPVALGAIAFRVGEVLAQMDPEGASGYMDRAEGLRTRAAALHNELQARLAAFEGRAFYIYHPALGYFANRYGLKQAAIAPGAQGPGTRALHRLIQEAREARIGVIFVQPQESRRQAELVAEAVGAQVVEIDPMARDWDSMLRSIGDALVSGFGTKGT